MADPSTNEMLWQIGMFTTNFSTYVGFLGHGIRQSLRPLDAIQNRIVNSLTASMTAAQLRDQFFAATSVVREPTASERAIRSKLNKRGQDLTERRNDIALLPGTEERVTDALDARATAASVASTPATVAAIR